MSKQREALLLALEALDSDNPDIMLRASIAIREALAEPEQKPVAWMCSDESMTHKGYTRFARTKDELWSIPVYTSPQTRKPLTDAEIDMILQPSPIQAAYDDLMALVRAIERAHGIGGGE